MHRAQQRRLLVERLAGVGTEERGDTKRGAVGVALDEGRACHVPGRIAARLESAPQPAAREARGVGFAHDQILTGETGQGLPHARGLEEGIVLLGRAPREGLEPVGEVGRAAVHRPLLEGVRHLVGDGRVQRRVVAHGVQQFVGRVFGQVFTHDAFVEDVRAVIHLCVVHGCSVLLGSPLFATTVPMWPRDVCKRTENRERRTDRPQAGDGQIMGYENWAFAHRISLLRTLLSETLKGTR